MELPPVLTLTEARKQLKARAQELLSAPPSRVSALVIEIQTYRVYCLLAEELENKTSNPDTYREMSLLTRIVKAVVGVEDPAQAQEEQTAETAKRLEDRGISQESARNIARVLQSFVGEVMVRQEDEDRDESDEPDAPPPAALEPHEP